MDLPRPGRMIPNDKIVAVCCAPRSGSSALMRAMMLGGVPIAGDQWPQLRRGSASDAESEGARAAAIERARRLNPHGFWEVPGVVGRGLREPGEHGGRAIKIVSPGCLPPHTDPRIVWRYVLLLRDPRAVAESQRDLDGGIRVAAPGPIDENVAARAATQPSMAAADGWLDHRPAIRPRRYLAHLGPLAAWHAGAVDGVPPADRERWITLDYDALVADPAGELARLWDFLHCRPSAAQVAAAAGSYDARLRRSARRFAGWPPSQQSDGRAAEVLYQALLELEPAQLAAARLAVEDRAEFRRLEAVRWYSPDVGWMIDASIERKLRSDPAYREALRRVSGPAIAGGLHPQVCEGYAAAESTYTIRRPADLGDLVARHCVYRGDLLSREDAFRLHQTLYCTDRPKCPAADPAKTAAWAWEW